MSAQLNPYLNFGDGQARAAAEFYHSVFGGDLKVNTYGEFGAPDAALADLVMHGQLTSERGYTLMVADAPPGMPHVAGTNVSCSLSGDPGEGLEEVWAKLADGATVTVPFEKQMWGDTFGQLTDRFGIQWMVNVVGA